MEWTLALVLLVLGVTLAGAIRAAWQGRDQQPASPPPPAWVFGVPHREGLPDRLSYIGGLLDECVARARRRFHRLERLDERLRKRASSPGWPAKP